MNENFDPISDLFGIDTPKDEPSGKKWAYYSVNAKVANKKCFDSLYRSEIIFSRPIIPFGSFCGPCASWAVVKRR